MAGGPTKPESPVPAEVLAAWGLGDATVRPVEVGLINRTYEVESGGTRLVLQQLHTLFAAEVNLDIEAITAHVEARGVKTPRPVSTREGTLWLEHEGRVWRALTHVDGVVLPRVEAPQQAGSAGGLVARFHVAVADLHHDFHFTRPGAHDTARHLRHLEDTLLAHDGHPRFAEIRPVAERILVHGASVPGTTALPARIIHGDLKITNVIFAHDRTTALALIDLDTLARGTIAEELGDALRSWCNPAGEDDAQAEVSVPIFEAAVGGYASAAGGLLTEDEVASLVGGTERIALELASRFCADALEESYFGWDPSRHGSRSEHNLVRARSQLALSESVRARRAELGRIVRAAFG